MKFVRYIGVQILAYGLDMGGFLLAFEFFGAGPIVANVFGKITAGVFDYFVHRSFTFSAAIGEKHSRQATLYFTLLALNVPFSSAVLSLVLFVVSPPALAKFLADVVCVFVTYAISKNYVFARRGKGSLSSSDHQEHLR